jgi:hypothetical protein
VVSFGDIRGLQANGMRLTIRPGISERLCGEQSDVYAA